MTSPILDIPRMKATQVQKEITFNEAMNLLEASLQISAEGILDVPPTAPEEGTRCIVGLLPEGDFEGQENKLAAWYSGWIFITPQEGWIVYDKEQAKHLTFVGGAWVDLIPSTSP